MDAELTRLLKEFDLPQFVQVACQEVFKQTKRLGIPEVIVSAVKDGLLIPVDGDKPVVGSIEIYKRDMVLTELGRDAVGLPRATLGTVSKKTAVQKGLFE